MEATHVFRPHEGPQELFLSSPADIAIYGGAAGGGKSYALLLEPLRHISNSGFGAVFFRRTMPNITNEGGLWDTSKLLYPYLSARQRHNPKPQWLFPSGARVTFSQLLNDDACKDYHSSQIPLMIFDELTEFTRYMFFYMMSRNRSLCGVDPYLRASCNPDADSWVADFISWWIDQKTGYPILERSGKLRYMARDQKGDRLFWGNTREEAAIQAGISPRDVKSVTFIAAKLEDNPTLLKENPAYKANLMAQPLVERERLLNGNWKIRKAAGMYFNRKDVQLLKERPTDIVSWVSRWDIAATEPSESNPDPDYLVRVLMGKRQNGRFFVANVLRKRVNAAGVRQVLKATSSADRPYTRGARWKIVLPLDPAAAGKIVYADYVLALTGFAVEPDRETGDKGTRAEPFSAQWQAGNIDILEADWNSDYLDELENFPQGKHDDQVDASSGAFNALAQANMPAPPPRGDQSGSTSYWLGR